MARTPARLAGLALAITVAGVASDPDGMRDLQIFVQHDTEARKALWGSALGYAMDGFDLAEAFRRHGLVLVAALRGEERGDHRENGLALLAGGHPPR